MLSLVLLGEAPVAGLAASPPDSIGTLRGRLFHTKRDRPLAWANIIVVDRRLGAQTDVSGCFVIRNVPVGTRALRIHHPGEPENGNCVVDVHPGDNYLGDLDLAALPPEIIPLHAPPVKMGVKAAVGPEKLEARIRAARQRFRVGDAPAFEVRIRNHGDHPVTLVRGIDGSEAWANPRVRIEIDGPKGGFVAPGRLECEAGEGLRTAHFSRIGPGKDFNPYAGGWLDPTIHRGRFAKPGRYTATFRYGTSASDVRAWIGCACAVPRLADAVRDLLEQVPAAELTATTTFDVEF